MPLVLQERSPAPGSFLADTDADSVRLVYRNESDRTIVASDFRCTVATNDGRTGWSGTSSDAFSLATIHRGEVRGFPGDNTIGPGETVEKEFGTEFRRDGPFAVQVCGPAAVILDDGSYSGAPEVLDPLFDRRRALVAEVRDLASKLRRLEAATPSGARQGALDELRTSAARLGGGIYSQSIEQLGQAHDAGSLPVHRVRQLRESVEADYQRALRHLRPSDRDLLDRDLLEDSQ
ncbi:MAG TPA: hypothetical protein VKU40_04655 [Thermoanaerobaculia bacterium]|nr:hypothetical protein [Thermoanaerobaculia bacterium]